MKENKLLQQIKRNDEKFDKKFPPFADGQFGDYTESPLPHLKSYITQSRISELEALVDIVNQIQEVEPESNGRFNACNEMREVLEDTITQLKTN